MEKKASEGMEPLLTAEEASLGHGDSTVQIEPLVLFVIFDSYRRAWFVDSSFTHDFFRAQRFSRKEVIEICRRLNFGKGWGTRSAGFGPFLPVNENDYLETLSLEMRKLS